MMVVVLITAPQPVHYSLNNGLTRLQYDPGEVYQLPLWAAQGFMARGWARAVNKDELESILKERDEPQDLPSFIEKREVADEHSSN